MPILFHFLNAYIFIFRLLLPYERYSRGEDYMQDLKRSDTPSPTPDGLVSPRKDQNANVVPHNQAIVMSQAAVSKQSVLKKPDIPPPLSHKMQQSQYESRFKPTLAGVITQQDTWLKPVITGVTSQRDTRLKATVTEVRSQQDTPLQTAVTGVRSQQDTRLKPVVIDLRGQEDTPLKSTITGAMSQQDTHLNTTVPDLRMAQETPLRPAVTSVISKLESRLKPVLTNEIQAKPKVTSILNQQVSRSRTAVTDLRSQQDIRSKPTVDVVMGHQETRLKPAVTDVRMQQNELFMTAMSRGAELGQKNMSNPTRMSVKEERQNVSCITSVKAQNKGASTNHQDRSVIAHNVDRIQYTKPTSLCYQQDRRSMVYTQHKYNKPADSPIEFITTGSRSSPVMYFSSNTDELSTRYTTFDAANNRNSARSGGFTGSTGSSERVATPESLRKNEYITEDYLYARQNKTESRMTEFESKPKYLSHVDQMNDFGIPRDYHVEESRDMHRHARSSGDEILLTNVIPGKRSHSPHEVIYSVPVYQPSHYPHAGFELYDLPNTAFPVRASSRIFMPPHQVFPGPGHPAFPGYTPHIIATIGTDPGTLYQLPMPGYYPQELAYPMDTGVQILHS
jgi:hypothetical protein